MKKLINIIDENDVTCLNSYRGIAEKLMNNYKLQVRNTFYRIVECEFYYSSKNHEDPYVHGHQRQKESFGEWYFHGSGLDITLSNGEAYGGILIRSIAEVRQHGNIERKDATMGPLNVCTEIFSKIGDVMADMPLHFGLREISRDPMGANMKTAKIFAVPRIGLNASKDNEKGFCKRPYRFISFLHLPHKESEKIKKYLLEDKEKPMSMEEYKLYYSGQKW